ncbi:hybrid sensor histidine kinase/response regulator [Oceanicola sp. S124]|uniref:hybrid sensor histidine kinase/response regulator n=1 Tax=Oceanicola sp. S124 TaxID=1042378 RepID=UPI00025582B6|nr:ATP-binding protein [Oceanicola sp. S124]
MPFRNLQRPLKPWEKLYLQLNRTGMRRILWGLAVLAVLAIPTLSLLDRSTRSQGEVAAGALPAALQELERSIGYGGFIHHFKNAVLRPDDPRYLDLALTSYENAQRALLRLQRLAREIDREVEVRDLRASLSAYRTMLDTARDAQERGLSIAEVDALVRLPDDAAVLNLDGLHREVRAAILDWQRQEVRDQRLRSLILGALLTLLAAIITFFQLTSRSAEVERRRRAEELHGRMKTLGEVTSGIAHDVNNLLATIFYALDLAMSEELPEKTRSFLTSARKAVERGQSLTGRLLSSTRPRRGAPEVLQLSDSFLDIEALARPQLAESGITLRVDLRQPGLAALCDRGMLEDSLLNLVINARDAMRDAGTGSQIRISAGAISTSELKRGVWSLLTRASLPETTGLDPKRKYLEITVADDGPGMPPEVLARALEPFFTTKPGRAGNGLGLSMVHSFATGAEGDMRIDSSPGKGTVIHIVLPRGKSSDAQQAQSVPPAPAAPSRTPAGAEGRRADSPSAAPDAGADQPPPETSSAAAPPPDAVRPGDGEVAVPATPGVRSGTILLAEDETPLRTLLTATLTSAGFRVIGAEDGARALELLRADPSAVDLILTDISMPGMDGFSFARAARDLREDLPVVYLTGYAGHAESDQNLLVKGPVLRKPCPPALLLRTLDAALALNR